MRKQLIQEINERYKIKLEEIIEIEKLIKANKAFNLNKVYKANLTNYDTSIQKMLKGFQECKNVIQGIIESKATTLIPIQILSDLKNSIEKLDINLIYNKFNDTVITKEPILAFNTETLLAEFSSGKTFDYKKEIDEFHKAFDSFLYIYLLISIYSKRKNNNADNDTIFDSLMEQINSVESESINIKNLHEETRSQLDAIKKEKEYANNQSEIIKNYYSNSESSFESIQEYEEEISERNNKINNILENAQELKDQVINYGEEFKKFDSNLTNREREYNKALENIKQYKADIEELLSQTEKLKIKSEQMLSSATNAGLAGHFGDVRNELTSEMKKAMRSFTWGICALFFLSIPLFFFIFPVLISLFPGSENLSKIPSINDIKTPWELLSQALIRIVLMTPAIWYITMSAKRYNSFFKLREHYTYKSTTAASVEGFKKQSPEYASEISAMVFEELAFNPTEKLYSKKDKKPRKVTNTRTYLFNKINHRLTPLQPKKNISEDEEQ